MRIEFKTDPEATFNGFRALYRSFDPQAGITLIKFICLTKYKIFTFNLTCIFNCFDSKMRIATFVNFFLNRCVYNII